MFNLIEFVKNIFFPKKAASELVDNLKNTSELTNDQTHMLGNLLKLGNIQIRDIMVPRADVCAINLQDSWGDIVIQLKSCSYSSWSSFP